MKLFKTIDEKFKDLGFEKIEENEIYVRYERYNPVFNYTHVLALCHKKSGNHLIQSYDKDLFDESGLGNAAVGLTIQEASLAVKKMKKMGWAE